MARQTINTGSALGDRTGDNGRVAFTKVNDNFTELYLGGYYPITNAEVSAGVVPTSYQYPELDVKRYGADPTGVADSSTAISNAILVAQTLTNGGYVDFGAGIYKYISGQTISDSRIHIRGAGMYATTLLYAPTATGTALKFSSGGSQSVQCSLSNLALYSDDSTYTKTALDIYDTVQFLCENVAIGGSIVAGSTTYWSGNSATSIGIRTRGREFGIFNNVIVAADKPLVVSVNPNSSIDIDHFVFRDVYLIANANPVVTIETGVELSNVSFAGKGPWAKGTYGLYWVDTTSTGQSLNLDLENVRWEQGTDSNAYLVRIEMNVTLQGLKLHKTYGGADRKGFYLRNVDNTFFDSTTFTGTGVALDADASCRSIRGVNTFWQAGSTTVLVGQRLVYGSSKNPNTGALPPEFYYDESTNAALTVETQNPQMGISVPIAQDATATIGTTALQGMLTVTTDENVSAIYCLRGSTATTAEVSDPDAFFTNTAGSASSYNIYATGGNYVIQNKRTGTHNVRWKLAGTHAF